ncbi:MAG: S41 family peptidase [Acidobacteriota bacterium]
MFRAVRLIGLLAFAIPGAAQLTTDQRIADFRNLADLVARKYAPLEWKRDTLKFDALNIAPWLDRIRRAKDDLDLYEISVEYIAALDDAHSGYYLPTTFVASLGFTVDIYEGKVLIDSINRDRLPAEQYPFEVGDELVSVDGKTSQELIAAFKKYTMSGNSRTTERVAASLIVSRWQEVMPRAQEIGDEAKIVVRRQDGSQQDYTIAWRKTGTPVTSLGPGPGPRTATIRAPFEDAPDYLDPLRRLEDFLLPRRRLVLGFGARSPIFAMPEGFVQRQGAGRLDFYFSGTYEAEGLRIGFIRIPSFEYQPVAAFETEIKFFQENTDGLVVDIMRNPGGSACTVERLLAYLMPDPFQGSSQEIVVTWWDVLGVITSLEAARARDPQVQATIERLEALADAYQSTYFQGLGRTKPVPICAAGLERQPAKDKDGNLLAYTKPILVLVDDMTASAGDLFAALIQDHSRGPLAGMRTVGAGGSPEGFDSGVYSEGAADLTMTLVVRKQPVKTPEFPATPYLENVGVRPDIVLDYMTKDNLMNKGKSFVEAFTKAMVEHIRAKAP